MSVSNDKIFNFVEKLRFSIKDEKIPPRIFKAIKMYKKESSLLYIDKTNESLKAVIKSQTNPDTLEYAVYLHSSGSFFCGTQNLHPCGGLRGKICKHIILALIAAIKSEQGTINELINWVDKTRNMRPNFIKSNATAIFLKYQNAIQGIIEWRPVEILPEDFIAL